MNIIIEDLYEEWLSKTYDNSNVKPQRFNDFFC